MRWNGFAGSLVFGAVAAAAYLPFLAGGTLVPDLDIQLLLAATPAGTIDLVVPIVSSFPDGILLYTHVWFQDGTAAGGYSASNAVEWELFRP